MNFVMTLNWIINSQIKYYIHMTLHRIFRRWKIRGNKWWGSSEAQKILDDNYYEFVMWWKGQKDKVN